MKTMADILAKDFVIFKVGTWNGETFTEADLDNMVSSFNEDEPPHIIIGHSSDYKGHTRIPSFGRVLGGLKRVGKDLIACGTEFNEELAKWIKQGFYNQRSVEMSRDNKRILAIGMLGATPPAVKGLPSMDEALSEIALEYSAKQVKSKVIEFADVPEIEMTSMDEVETLAVQDTFKSVSECCALFLTNIEALLASDKYDGDRLMQEVWELQSDLMNELNLHAQFIKKIEQVEESTEPEYSDKFIGWKEFKETVKQLFTKRKESEMDKQKEQDYLAKIAELEAKNKEYADEEAKEIEAKVAEEAKVKADAEAEATAKAEAEALAKDEAIKEEVKEFCVTAIKENRMTPAMRETDEPIMFTLAKTNDEALKSFQQKYNTPIVPLGEIKEMNQIENDHRPQVIKDAEKYVKAHAKDFSMLESGDAINRAIYLLSMGKIKFGDK